MVVSIPSEKEQRRTGEYYANTATKNLFTQCSIEMIRAGDRQGIADDLLLVIGPLAEERNAAEALFKSASTRADFFRAAYQQVAALGRDLTEPEKVTLARTFLLDEIPE